MKYSCVTWETGLATGRVELMIRVQDDCRHDGESEQRLVLTGPQWRWENAVEKRC